MRRIERLASPTEVSGKARYGILMWLLGVPLPLILLFYLIGNCS